MKKYELLPVPVPFSFEGSTYTLYKIKALETFGDVSSGQTGGYVESTDNLSQFGCCWLYDNAKVFAGGRVFDSGKAFDNVIIGGNGKLYGCAEARENAQIVENACVHDCVKISGNGVIKGYADVYDMARVYDNGIVEGNAKVRGLLRVYGDNHIKDSNWE